jgi:small-conductance mechanosensitive channel
MDMQGLRDILEKTFFGNTLQAYIAAVIIFVVVMCISWILRTIILKRLHKWAKATNTDIDDFIIESFRSIGAPVYTVIAVYLAASSLALPGGLDKIIQLLFVLVLTVKVVRILQGAVVFLLGKWSKRGGKEDKTSVAVAKNLAMVMKGMLWAGAVLFIFDNLGIDITAAVAGLGIGGVAVALAAQSVLGDTFSAFSIFIDRPFEVGDFIIVGDLLGTVEHVGFKTTRVRSLGGEQLVFSNSDLTGSRIRNYKRMQTRRIVFEIGVTYQTSLEQLKAIPEIIQGIIDSDDKTKFDRAHFKNYGDFALIFETVFIVKSPDYNVYMDLQQAINLKLFEEFAKRGIEFAYPTQQVFHTQVSPAAH